MLRGSWRQVRATSYGPVDGKLRGSCCRGIWLSVTEMRKLRMAGSCQCVIADFLGHAARLLTQL